MRTIKIGAVEIPLRSGLDLETSADWIGGQTVLRTLSGTGIKQATWRKLRLTFSGGGWIPPGLAGIDTTQPQIVASATPCAITADAQRRATLPPYRRADPGYTPWAWALMSDGSVLETDLQIVGDLGTAAAISGAAAYQILYYPQITAWVTAPVESGARSTASYRWEISAEQV